ncbi:MAG: T9SS type A sorting domain-containing protein [Flavobacteriales bacterium]|nr:T9SS type A sorting domain-containing protein [Flavobacteriales bacterium]
MKKNGIGRHCDSCEKTVIDFTGMNPHEIKQYLREQSQPVCGRIQRDRVHIPDSPPAKKSIIVLSYLTSALLMLLALFPNRKAIAQKTEPEDAKTPTESGSSQTTGYREIVGKVSEEGTGDRISFAIVGVSYKGDQIATTTTDYYGNYTIRFPINQPLDHVDIQISVFAYETVFMENISFPHLKEKIYLKNEMRKVSDFCIIEVELKPKVTHVAVGLIVYKKAEVDEIDPEPEVLDQENEVKLNAEKTNVMNTSDTTHLRLYPNPADEYVKILLTQKGDYNLEIFDSQGNLLYSQMFSGKVSLVNTTNFPSGIYTTRITSRFWTGPKSEQLLVVH